MTFQMRNFLPGEYQMIRDWGNQVDWNEGYHDYLAFQKLDKEGFWMGLLDGKPITTISVVQYDQNFAFIGLYITKEQYRGQGFGSKIWKKALSRITAKVIGLQGVIQQQLHYEKLGFKSYHKTITHSMYGTNRHHDSQYLVDCKKLDIDKLSAYDRKNFPSERKDYLEKWISVPQSKALAFVKDGCIEGYGVLRRSTQGFRVGPLCADSYQIARQIFETLIGSLSENDKVLLDIPDINKDAMKLAEEFKMLPGFTCARMYTNQMPDIPFDKTVYGFASIQLG